MRSTGACEASRKSWGSRRSLPASRMRCPAASASGWRWVGPSFAIPKVFLFDEPLSNLDASLRVSTRNELIKQQHELGTTTIYVTHDQVEAMTMGDRICIMNGGEVVQIGKPLEVYRQPADSFVARFLGNPPMNLLPARLERQEDPLCPARRPEALSRSPAIRRRRSRPLCGSADHPRRAAGGSLRGARRQAARANAGDAARILAVEPLGAETLLMLVRWRSGRGAHRPHRTRHGAEAWRAGEDMARHDGHSSVRSCDDEGDRNGPLGRRIGGCKAFMKPRASPIATCTSSIPDDSPFCRASATRPGRRKSGPREALRAVLDAHGVSPCPLGSAELLRLRQFGDGRCDGCPASALQGHCGHQG